MTSGSWLFSAFSQILAVQEFMGVATLVTGAVGVKFGAELPITIASWCGVFATAMAFVTTSFYVNVTIFVISRIIFGIG